MNEFTLSIEIAAPPERVWAETIDIERWPEWTPTVKYAKRLDAGPITVGSRVRIDQPKLPPALWVVQELEPGRRMKLKSGLPGMFAIAHHRIEPRGTRTMVHLSIEFTGLFGGLLARWTRDMNHRYLALEASGLKRRCEQPAR
jgi:uncharacterized protein YndB with AHSA1/START domain